MKLLKVYISAFCMCSLSVLLNSCDDFLKEEPLDMKSSDQFWKTKADAESGVNALYFGGVPYLHNTDVGGGWTPKRQCGVVLCPDYTLISVRIEHLLRHPKGVILILNLLMILQ